MKEVKTKVVEAFIHREEMKNGYLYLFERDWWDCKPLCTVRWNELNLPSTYTFVGKTIKVIKTGHKLNAIYANEKLVYTPQMYRERLAEQIKQAVLDKNQKVRS